jgi:hypothetical protein
LGHTGPINLQTLSGRVTRCADKCDFISVSRTTQRGSSSLVLARDEQLGDNLGDNNNVVISLRLVLQLEAGAVPAERSIQNQQNQTLNQHDCRHPRDGKH